MSAAILAVGSLALTAFQTYEKMKADQAAQQAALNESDQAAIAELDKQIAANVAGADAAERQLDGDLGIASEDVRGLGTAGQL